MTQAEAVQKVVPGGVLTQTYGWTSYARDGAYGGRIHDGWDIAAPYGTRIYWPTAVGNAYGGYEAGGYGRFTVGTIGPWQFLFGHEAQTGNTAYAGLLDSTGYSTGNHTHLRVKLNGATVDPQVFFNQLGGDVGITQAQYDAAIAINQAAALEARRGLISHCYRLYLGRDVKDSEYAAWQNKTPTQIVNGIKGSAEAKAFNPTGYGARK